MGVTKKCKNHEGFEVIEVFVNYYNNIYINIYRYSTSYEKYDQFTNRHETITKPSKPSYYKNC